MLQRYSKWAKRCSRYEKKEPKSKICSIKRYHRQNCISKIWLRVPKNCYYTSIHTDCCLPLRKKIVIYYTKKVIETVPRCEENKLKNYLMIIADFYSQVGHNCCTNLFSKLLHVSQTFSKFSHFFRMCHTFSKNCPFVSNLNAFLFQNFYFFQNCHTFSKLSQIFLQNCHTFKIVSLFQ